MVAIRLLWSAVVQRETLKDFTVRRVNMLMLSLTRVVLTLMHCNVSKRVFAPKFHSVAETDPGPLQTTSRIFASVL